MPGMELAHHPQLFVPLGLMVARLEGLSWWGLLEWELKRLFDKRWGVRPALDPQLGRCPAWHHRFLPAMPGMQWLDHALLLACLHLFERELRHVFLALLLLRVAFRLPFAFFLTLWFWRLFVFVFA